MMDQRRRQRRPDAHGDTEVIQRVRRIETRLTSLLVHMGIDTPAQRPEFRDGTVHVPSPHSTLKEIVDSIPTDWSGPVAVYVGNQFLANVDRSD